jgi:hypothetical protein
MIQSKLGFKLLGLCALVIGLMAVSASAAQAAGFWDVNGVKDTLLATIQVKEIEELNPPAVTLRDVSLLANILGAHVVFQCEKIELNGVATSTGGTLDHGDVTFSECVTFAGGSPIPNCQAKSSGQPNGTILTKPLEGELFKEGDGKKVVLIRALKDAQGKPVEELFLINTGPKCFFGEDIPVVGTLALTDPALETSSQTHLIVTNTTWTKLGVFDLQAGNAATLNGSAITLLVGNHLNQNWNGLLP